MQIDTFKRYPLAARNCIRLMALGLEGNDWIRSRNYCQRPVAYVKRLPVETFSLPLAKVNAVLNGLREDLISWMIECDAFDDVYYNHQPEDFTTAQLVAEVNRQYAGGIAQFLADTSTVIGTC